MWNICRLWPESQTSYTNRKEFSQGFYLSLYTPKEYNRDFIDWFFIPLLNKWSTWRSHITSNWKWKIYIYKRKVFHDRIISLERYKTKNCLQIQVIFSSMNIYIDIYQSGKSHPKDHAISQNCQISEQTVLLYIGNLIVRWSH